MFVKSRRCFPRGFVVQRRKFKYSQLKNTVTTHDGTVYNILFNSGRGFMNALS